MKDFKLDPNAELNGTFGIDTNGIPLIPSKLIEVFGKPEESDGFKVSGEFAFTTPNGNPIRIYDWKQTSLYDSEYESPEEFWAATDVRTFNIGGNDAARAELEDFKKWLNLQLINSVRYITREDK